MKKLTDRVEIAKAIHSHTTLVLDVSKQDEYGIKGPKVRVDYHHSRTGEFLPINGMLRVYKDEKYLTVVADSVCLKNSFGYTDLITMTEYENAPLIKPGSQVCVVIHDSVRGLAWSPILLDVAEILRPNCVEPIVLEKLNVFQFVGMEVA